MRGIKSGRFRKLVQRAQKTPGWTVRIDGRTHVRVTSPTGQWFYVSTTLEDKDPHAYQNARAAARRAGLDVTGL